MPDAVPGWFDHVRAPLALTDEAAATVLALNGEARRLFADAMPALPCALAVLVGEQAALLVAGMPRADPAAAPRTIEARVAGKVRTLGLALSRLEDGRHLLTIQDRMVEDEAAHRLVAMEDELHDIMETLPVGIEIYDGEQNCIFANSHGAATLGYAPEEVLSLDDWWAHGYPDPAYRAAAMAAWHSGVRATRADPGHVHMADWMVTCKDGSQKMIHFRLRALGDKLVLVYWDVSDHRQLVTGVSNRRRFLVEAEGVLVAARHARVPVSLLMIDLDFFKAINDRYGHAAGDLMLRDVADKCRRTLREQDLLARLGGEEFAALMPGTGESEACRIAETLCKFISASPLLIEGRPIRASVSIGLAVLDAREPRAHRAGGGAAAMGDATTSPAELSDLLRRADEALYAAKRGGRNRVARDGEVPSVA